MRYLGGKSRSAKHIVSAIIADIDARGPLVFYDPFMGGGSVMIAAAKSGAFSSVMASDVDGLVVAYWRALLEGWVPPTNVSEDEWRMLKSDNSDLALSAHAAYNCSFGGKRWGGYARGMKSDGATPRNFADEASRNDVRAVQSIGIASVVQSDYIDALDGVGSGDVVYLDPPYAGTTGYATGRFDSNAMWALARELGLMGARVYVSEYAAPDWAEAIWSKDQPKSVSGGSQTRKRAVDKLFRVPVLA